MSMLPIHYLFNTKNINFSPCYGFIFPPLISFQSKIHISISIRVITPSFGFDLIEQFVRMDQISQNKRRAPFFAANKNYPQRKV